MKILNYRHYTATLISSPFVNPSDHFIYGFYYIKNNLVVYDIGLTGLLGNSASINFKCI